MAQDVYFLDETDGKFYMRKGGNKIESLGGFFLLREKEGNRKHPSLEATLIPTVTVDRSHVVYLRVEKYPIYTARRLNKDGTFLPPKAPPGFVCQPYPAPAPRALKQKKRPRR